MWYSVTAVDTHTPIQVPQFHLAIWLFDSQLFDDGSGGEGVPVLTVGNFWDTINTESRWRLWRVHDVELHAPVGDTNQAINYGQARNDWRPCHFTWRGRRKGTLDHARNYVFGASLAPNDYFAAQSASWAGTLRIDFMAKFLIQH